MSDAISEPGDPFAAPDRPRGRFPLWVPFVIQFASLVLGVVLLSPTGWMFIHCEGLCGSVSSWPFVGAVIMLAPVIVPGATLIVSAVAVGRRNQRVVGVSPRRREIVWLAMWFGLGLVLAYYMLVVSGTLPQT